MHQKSASIYLRSGNLYISPLSLVAPNGPWVRFGSPYVINTDSSVEEIGISILEALDKSQLIKLPENFDLSENDALLYSVAAVKSWSAFEKPDTKYVSVTRYDDGRIQCVPSWNRYLKEGRGRGFLHFGPEKYVTIFSSSPKDVGEAVLESLKRSE